MSVAKIIEISATSPNSFDEAVKLGIERASKSVRNIQSAWIKDQRVTVSDNKVKAYQVNMQLTFLLEEGTSAS